jgi:hypothetical protein
MGLTLRERRNTAIHPHFLDALRGLDTRGRQVDPAQASRFDLARKVIADATPEHLGFLYETLTAHPHDPLTIYFHAAHEFADDADGAARLALLNLMERRTGQPLTPDASGLLSPAAATPKAAPAVAPPTWQTKRASVIHQHFLYALQGKNRYGRPAPGQSRWVLARKVIEDADDTAHVGYLHDTITRHPEDWLYRYFHNEAVFADDASWQKRTGLVNAMEARLGVDPSPAPRPPGGNDRQTALRPVEAVKHLDATTDPVWSFAYHVGDATGPNVLVDIVDGADGVRLQWFNFHRDTAVMGTTDDWRVLNLAGAFVPATSAYQKFGKMLSLAEWRALGASPAAPLLARYEARSLDLPDEVVVDIYEGLVFQSALSRLDENERALDHMLEGQHEIDRRRQFAADLKEASIVRDAIEGRLADVRRTLSRREYAPTILYMPGLAPLPSLPQRFAGMREEAELQSALGMWMQAFPLLTRFKTDEISPDSIRTTLEKIKGDIQQARKDLVGDGVHAPKLDPWSLANVRPAVDATLGARARAVIEAESTSRSRWAWVSAGASVALSIGLLFLPGGVFIDTLIGVAMLSKSWDEAETLGHASNTGIAADAGLVTVFQARLAEFAAIFGTVLLVVGTAAQGLRLLQKWRVAIAIANAEAAGIPAPAARGIRAFFLGQKTLPTQTDMDAVLVDAWKTLGGAPGKIPKVSLLKLPGKTAGWFDAFVGQFGEVAVSATAQTRGQMINTIFHEAMHARLRELFPILSERLTQSPIGRQLLRHMDEIAAYAFGAYGQITRGVSVADKLSGLFQAIMSPWSAYGSANTFLEAVPGLVRDAAIMVLYFRWLVLTYRERYTPAALPAPAPGAP